MPNKTKPPIVIVKIVPGPGKPTQVQSYKRFWQQLVATVRDKAKREGGDG